MKLLSFVRSQRASWGPWLVTADEAPPERARSQVCGLNGQQMQRSLRNPVVKEAA